MAIFFGTFGLYSEAELRDPPTEDPNLEDDGWDELTDDEKQAFLCHQDDIPLDVYYSYLDD
jgi:hypothetical protein